MAEMRGFVFAITFIVIFAALVSSIPTGLLGTGGTPEDMAPVDPSLITGFSSYENYSYSAFSAEGALYLYQYTLNTRYWTCAESADTFTLGAKIYWANFLWLGGYDYVLFGDRGQSLTMAEIEADAEEGTITYPLVFVTSGSSAGSFVVYWNTTEYSDPADAWDNDKLYLVHGIGVESTAAINALSLLLQLLFFQLPEVPTLINVLLIAPLWSAIVYVIWFVIKESMPFV